MRRINLFLISILSFWGLNLLSQTTSCFSVNSVINSTCPGLKTGSISLNISGGSGSYSIFFNGSTTSSTQTTFINLSVGTYTFRILDTKNVNCTKTLSLDVNNYLIPTVTITGNNSFCPGQDITLSAILDKTYSTSYTYKWSNGNVGTPNNFVPTSAGTYSVTVTDAAGCSVTASKSITQSSGPMVTFSGNYTNCPGNSVTLVPSISGGISPYTYTWDGVTSTTANKTVNPTSPQTYCLTVKDANNCTGSACVTVNQRFLNVSLPTGVSVCQGDNYNIIPVVSNFSGALTYKWSNGGSASNNLITVNATQSHSLTVTDGAGCSGSSSTSIGMVSDPVISLPSSIEVCQFGSVTLDTKLSSTSHTFRWSTGSTASQITLSPSVSNTVSVTVTNVNKCQSTASVNVNVKSNPVISLPTSQTTCANTPFTLSPSISGGTPAYNYLWSNGSTTNSLTTTLSASGAINLKVTDQSGCSANWTTSVNVRNSPTATISGNTLICSGQSTTLNTIVSGGTSPYTYKWSSGQNTQSLSVTPTSVTTYIVTVTDNLGCTNSSNITVSPTKSITVSLPTGVSICQGDNYNIIPVVSNFSGALTYKWSNGGSASNNLITVDATQSHSLTVTDGAGCSGSSSTSIGMVSNPVISLPSSVEVCQSGSVTLDTKLSSTSHTFRWSTGSTVSQITLSPSVSNTVSVTITNVNKCQSTASVNVNVKSNPVISLPTSQTTCANTPFTLSPSVSGGTPAYNYLWSNGSTTNSLTTTLSASGTINLKVTDQSGCSGFASIGINLVAKPTVSISGVFEICPGQTTTISALSSGGTTPYAYQWSTGEINQIISVKPTNAENYKITVTDKNNCSGEATILVSPTKSISVSLPSSTNICIGDSLNLKPVLGLFSGDLNYLWSNNQTSSTINVKPTSTSKYSLTVKDNQGCLGFSETIVNVNKLPEADLPDIFQGCLMDSAVVSISNISGAIPISLKWSNGSTLNQTNYFVDTDKPISVNITDVNNCKTTLYSKIIANNNPVLNLNNQYTFCGNEPVKIIPVISGGLEPYTYLWSNGSTLAELNTIFKENTNLSLRITDAKGCKDLKQTILAINNDIPKIIMPDTLRSCLGQDLILNPTVQDKIGIKSYIWSDGQTSLQISKKVLNPFSMRLQVINLIGCMALDSLFILPYHNPSVNLPEFFEVCKSNKISIEIPNSSDKNTVYQWSTGENSNRIDLLAESEKQIKVWATNAEGCKDSSSTFLKILNNPLVKIIGKEDNCSNTPSSFFADISSGNAPFKIKWASGETTTKVDYPAVDSIQKVGVEVIDTKGCKTFTTLPITILKSPEIQFPKELFVCEKEEIYLSPLVTFGKKPYSYLWNTGETSAGIKGKSGIYAFKVTDSNGCSNTKNIQIQVHKAPELFISFIQQPSCNLPNGQIKVGLKNIISSEVIWSNGTKGLLLENAYPGTYTAAVLDSNRCLSEITQNLICTCENKAGLMDENLVSICKNEFRESKFNATNQKIGLNSARWFIMHNSPGVNLGNQILYLDTIGVIKYVPGMVVGETYYFSTVIGRKLSNGLLDLNDPCLSISTGTPVKISPTPETPFKISVSDTLVCPGSSISLQTNKQENGFIYHWKTPVGNIKTLTPTLTIPNFEVKDIGSYFVSIGSEKCNSNLFGPVSIQFSKEINEIFTEPDKTVCGKDSVFINANMPSNAVGKWLTGSPAIINNPEEEYTLVKGLIPGKNEFLWTVITRNCIITDTLKVYYVPQPKLKNDTVDLDDTKNTALFDFLENDDLSNIPPSFLKINLISKPNSGNLSVNKEGFFNYSRDPNISEDQSFIFVYEVCNTDTTGNCVNNCDQAEVILNVTYNPRTLIYPTIGIRPNFNNPVWKFEAARPLYSAQLSILDRWGKVVFKEDFLQLQKGEIVGNWNGLTQNQVKLPAGAYYFSLIGVIENNEKVVQNGIIYLLE